MMGPQWQAETTQRKGNPGEAPNVQAPNFSLHRKELWLVVSCVSLDLAAWGVHDHCHLSLAGFDKADEPRRGQ